MNKPPKTGNTVPFVRKGMPNLLKNFQILSINQPLKGSIRQGSYSSTQPTMPVPGAPLDKSPQRHLSYSEDLITGPIDLLQSWDLWGSHQSPSLAIHLYRDELVSRVNLWETCQMPTLPELVLLDHGKAHAGNSSYVSL